MLTFKSFLMKEMAAVGKQGKEANAQGVVFETALSAGLHHKGEFAEHHPDDNGMNAEQAYHHHSMSLSDSTKQQVAEAIKPSVKALRKHLAKAHGIPENHKLNIAWTSKPGQLARTTGNAADHDNPGDLAVHHPESKKHIAVSLKFGSKPGLRSPGLADLHKLAKVDMDTESHEKHYKDLAKIGEGHVEGKTAGAKNKSYRELEKDSSKQHVVDAIKKRSLEHRNKIAGHLADGFNNLSTEEHHKVVRRLMNAEHTNTPTVKLHYDTKKREVHISEPSHEMDKIQANTSKYSFEHKGMYIHVHAHDKDGKQHHIATIGIKNNSSPFTHIVGNVSKGKGYDKFLAANGDSH